MENKLMNIELDNEGRITSVDLVEIINHFREVESINGMNGKLQKPLAHADFMKKIRKQLKMLKTLKMNYEEDFKPSSYINSQNKTQPCYSLNENAIKILIDVTINTDVIPLQRVYEFLGGDYSHTVCLKRKEESFIEELTQVLKPFGIKGKCQYVVKKEDGSIFKIDYYISKLNIAIEYDEEGHSRYPYEKEEGRQEYIENKIGCKFIRVSEQKNNLYNIGVVLKEITPLLVK